MPDLNSVVAAYRAGNYQQASAQVGQLLKQSPVSVDLLNLAGAIAQGSGDLLSALSYFDRVAELAPNNANAHYNKGYLLELLQRPSEAMSAYLKALSINPQHRDASLNLGVLHQANGQFAEAQKLFRALVAFNPRDVDALVNLGSSLINNSDLAGALDAYQRALSIDAKDHRAHHGIGMVLEKKGDLVGAETEFRTARELSPHTAEYANALGLIFMQFANMDRAVAEFQAAVTLSNNDPRFVDKLAAAYVALGRFEDAIKILQLTLVQDPARLDARFNLASALADKGDLLAATSELQIILSNDPQYADAHYLLAVIYGSLGFVTASGLHLEAAKTLAPGNMLFSYASASTLMEKGDWVGGWKCFERRLDMAENSKYRSKGVVRRAGPPAYWRGEVIADKRLYIWSEQGVGDEVLLSSLISDVAKLCQHLTLACSPRMVPILKRSFPGIEVVDQSSSQLVAQACDLQIAIGSLGQFVRADRKSFPHHHGYLRADLALVKSLRNRYGAKPNVGLAWRSHLARLGAQKSAPLGEVLGQIGRSDIAFHSLQYGPIANELDDLSTDFRRLLNIDPSIDQLSDLDSFFAQVAAMDLVITTSNTTAHVAGSLGVPTWLMIPSGLKALWYWLPHQTDNPWYPTMRIYRGRSGFDSTESWWRQPLAEIARDLRNWHPLSLAP